MSKHTPGPWATGRIEGAGDSLDWSITAGWQRIAILEDPDDSPTQEANAKLMVAAPELLAACELASEQEECVCEDKPKAHGTDGECLGCVLTAALEGAKS